MQHFHITVLDSAEDLDRLRESEAIRLFVGRLFPHIDHSTYVSPGCHVWLAYGAGLKTIGGWAGAAGAWRLCPDAGRPGRRNHVVRLVIAPETALPPVSVDNLVDKFSLDSLSALYDSTIAGLDNISPLMPPKFYLKNNAINWY